MSETVTEQQVLDALRQIEDPDFRRDIVSLGFVKDLAVCAGAVKFTIELTTPACPVKDRFKQQAHDVVAALPGVEKVTVNMTAQVRSSLAPSAAQLLPGVKNVIPVASGKGGVGKSTVAANLACALKTMGAKVGIMDADVYGPSIPTIMGVTDHPREGKTEGSIVPPEVHGIKVISTGFFIRPDQAVIWRGPMLVKMIDQFLGGVEWNDLDYLVIDLPPGTGDIQLSLCQKLPLTGSAVITTPQDVALNVAEKAIRMFDQLKSPVLGIVENMSYHICGHCGEKEYIFGEDGGKRSAERLKLPFLGEIPLMPRIRQASDDGTPIVLSDPKAPEAAAFLTVAQNLAAQVSIRQAEGQDQDLVQINF